MRNLEEFNNLKDQIDTLLDQMSEQLTKDCDTDFMSLTESLEHLDYVKKQYTEYAKETSKWFTKTIEAWENHVRYEISRIVNTADEYGLTIGTAHE